MVSLSKRMLFGFIAGAVSVVTFHAAVWALLHFLEIPGLTMPPPYPTDAIPPFGVPRIVSLSFWGGLWGLAFAAVWRGRRDSLWWGGLLLGLAAVVTGFTLVAALKGLPIGGNWAWNNWFRSILINGTWGLGVGIILLLITRGTAMDRRIGD